MFNVISYGLGAVCIVLAVAGFAGPDKVKTDQAAEGKALYNGYCLICHGANMVNFGTSSYDLRKFPEDQKERFSTSVLQGKNSMPAWGHVLDAQDVDALWAYVLTRGK